MSGAGAVPAPGAGGHVPVLAGGGGQQGGGLGPASVLRLRLPDTEEYYNQTLFYLNGCLPSTHPLKRNSVSL